MRFAFKGRVSTEDNQDPESSRNWQLTRARQLIEPRGGTVVAQYFDVGHSRSLPWQRRPEAIALLAALADPRRGFDAVVVGEPQREFYGNQFGLVFPLFEHYEVPLWVPEVGGPVDPANEAHDLIMSVYGGMSKGERNRIKVRVRSAMAAQAQTEGRFLGGRPPYGYQLADAGPHPNPAKAADGRRLHKLELDPEAATVVRRIFRQFVEGLGILAIAEGLTREGVPCPSAHDRARNSHRTGIGWSKGAVRVVLTNARYTGHQTWNKQRKTEVLLDVADVGMGHVTKMRWNDPEVWVSSTSVVHPPIVDDETFQLAQDTLAARARANGSSDNPRRRSHPYQLRGRMRHVACGRRMQGSWNNGKPHYRCSFPAEYGTANGLDHPRSVYVREELVVPPLDLWIARVFAPSGLSSAVSALLDVQELDVDRRVAETVEAAKRAVAECDRKLSRHRAALEAGADPALVTGWIAETQAERAAALRRTVPPKGDRLTRRELEAAFVTLGEMARVVADAEPDDKADLYRELGVELVFDETRRKVVATVESDPVARVLFPPPHSYDHVVGAVSPLGHRPLLHDRDDLNPFRCVIDLDAA